MASFHSRPAELFAVPSVMSYLRYHVKEGQLGGLRQCRRIFLAVRGTAAATSTTTNVRVNLSGVVSEH